MSFVLLVNTAFKTSDRNEFFQLSPPLGLLAISAALEEAGISVELIDPQISEDYEDQVREAVARRPFFVGMTTFMGPNILNAQNLTNLIHQCDSGVPVIWGGPLATSSPDLCFDQSTVDYIVLGMGEDTVVSLVDTLKKGGDPGSLPHVLGKGFQDLAPKTVYSFSGDLDALPFPSLHKWDEGIRRLGIVPILSSRGCPRNCAFCYNNTFIGRKCWYGRSPDSILSEMEHWADRHGIRKFYFVDDNFLVHTRRAIEILDRCREKGFVIDQVLGHLIDFTPEILEHIDESIGHVGFSVESASDKIQSLLNKKLDMGKVMDFVKLMTGKGISKITTNFMFGLPTETEEDIQANIDAARALRNINEKIRIIPYVYTPQPGDDIVSKFDWRKDIYFSLDNLSYIDMAPNRSNVLLPEIRPWMNDDDIRFYLDFVLAWFYHFDYIVRTDQGDVLKHGLQNPRVATLFRGVPMP
jgi:radical SAM superfamily enzyme YgiQ (UPF0313 family)